MPIYPWKRFWSKPAGTLHLDDLGCLIDPEQVGRLALNPDVVTLEEVADTSCLALLGEPGSGKTSALESECLRLQRLSPAPELHFVNLKDYGSEQSLYSTVFDSAWWGVWRTGTSKIVVIVDALDEGLLRVSNLSRVIARGLATQPLDRLIFRIACRTADWPSSFEQQLLSLFGADRVAIYELAPLRQEDIRLAATIENVDPQQFISQLHDKQVGPLASKPLTLRLLLRTFSTQGGYLARSQTELYELGCLQLCGEPDRERRELNQRRADLGGTMTPNQRMAVASRIAAAMLLANRSAVYLDDVIDAPDTDALLADLAGGEENVDGASFVVDQRAARETLSTGLFTARGIGRLGWSHLTYAEFLAARYLRPAPFAQIRSLLTSGDDVSGHLVPQLRDLAAELAAHRPDVFNWVVATEPDALLRGDMATVDDHFKQTLVTSLLRALVSNELLDTLDLRSHYKKLRHPTLDQQLDPTIRDRTLGTIPRRAAIDIAEACEATDLQALLLSVALDPTEPHVIRTQAAHAVWRIGDPVALQAMEPLARGDVGDDPDDDLRGIALSCLWPTYLSVEHLTPCLTPPKRDYYIGQYELFLTDRLLPGTNDPDLPQLLTAAMEWPSSPHEHLSSFSSLPRRLIRRAWDSLASPAIVESLAPLLTALIRKHALVFDPDKDLPQGLKEAPQKRRLLLEVILNQTNISCEECIGLITPSLPLLTDDDAIWCLSAIAQAPAERQPAWARCIGLLARGSTSSQLIDGILEKCPEVPALAAEFGWLLQPSELASDEARQARESYQQAGRWREETARRSVPLDPSPQQRIIADLDRLERGDSVGWIHLVLDLTLEPTSQSYNLDFTTCPNETPGWAAANAPLRDRFRLAAKSYVLRFVPDNHDWIGTNEIPYWVLAGYQAWRLLLDEPEFLSTVPSHIWEAWAPTLIAYPGQGHPWHEAISCLAYVTAPSQTLQSLKILLDREDATHGDLFCLQDLTKCWDMRLSAFLFERLKARPISPGAFFTLGELILSHGHVDATQYLAEGLTHPANVQDVDLAPFAFSLLLVNAADVHWEGLSAFLEQEPDLAERGFARIAGHRHHNRVEVFNGIKEEYVGVLYLWMSKRFPQATDPAAVGFHDVGERELLADLRDAALQSLVNRGTSKACQTLQVLIPQLPEQQPWLTWRLREAEAIARRRAWQPPPLSIIIRLLQDRRKRYVESPQELVAVLLESLTRLQDRFKGALPAVVDLWNYEGGGARRVNPRPKDEEDLSDYLARWLAEDLSARTGVVVNREVQLRRGQETDIHVVAIRPTETGTHDLITVIIEVKGCWNEGLWTAMQTQLVDRYLSINGLTHGVYAVGWYLCQAWADRDLRKRRTPEMSSGVALTRLVQQADEIARAAKGIRIAPLVFDLALPQR